MPKERPSLRLSWHLRTWLRWLLWFADGTISSKIAKKVFVHLAKNGGSAKEYVQKAGLIQISDPAQLLPIIQQVFADNEKAINDYKGGNKNAAKSLIGQLMKATKGQANPQVAQKLLDRDRKSVV